jgi:hypothetical protein
LPEVISLPEVHTLTDVHSPIPERTPLRSALIFAAPFAVAVFLIHFFSSLWGMHLGYGYFRDDMYFLVCGRHLAWGYVDLAPMVALQARLAETLFGTSPTGVRIFSFAAHGVTVLLTGLLARQFGGRRPAQALAMVAVIVAPVLLGTGNFLTMNSFEPCFWMGSMLVLLRIADGSAHPRAWLLFGLIAGLGIENKHSTVFFLIAVLLGLLLTPQRRLLASWYCAAGVAVITLVALPNFLWQWVNHFPTYEFLRNISESDKNLRRPPIVFLYEQIKVLLFSTAPIWIGGILWLGFSKRARAWRFVAVAYIVFLALMIAMNAKHYYLAPIYPVLFAAGAVALSQIARRESYITIYAAIIGFAIVFTGPITLTILPPARYNAITSPFKPDSVRMEKYTSPLPQILSDRFGWPQMVQGFATRYAALPPDVRSKTGIFCSNYGEASAVNIFGPAYGLPTAISGHVNYFFWGWNNYSGDSMLTLGNAPADYKDLYEEVIDLGPFDPQWSMDFEHRHYYWLRHRKRPYAQDWPSLKKWN